MILKIKFILDFLLGLILRCVDDPCFSGLGIEMTEPLYLAPSLSDVLTDLIFPQNLPSIVCVHVLDPHIGETVLDMCAAPGETKNT